MKSVLTTTMSAIIFATGFAQAANYQCKSYNGKVTMTVLETQATRVGDTKIFLETDGQKSSLAGLSHIEPGVLMSQQVVNLFPFEGDTLTITKSPKKCGRGACDFEAAPHIAAVLKINENETFFNCHAL